MVNAFLINDPSAGEIKILRQESAQIQLAKSSPLLLSIDLRSTAAYD